MKRNESASIPLAAEHFDRLPDSAQVDVQVVTLLIGAKARSTTWRWVKKGRLPKPRRADGSNMSRFNVGELRESLAVLKKNTQAAA